jgi:putative phage-type endonuclease
MPASAAAIPLPVLQNTPAWLDARRDVVGSSDIPVITGNSAHRTSVLSLWAVKTRLLEPEVPDEDTQEMYDLGHALEPVIAARYTLKTGREVARVNRLLKHRTLPHIGASLDRRVLRKGVRRIVELKWAPHRRWSEGDEQVPAGVQDQVQFQLLVTGYDVADVAVLNGSHVEVFEVEPNKVYQDNLVFLAHDFWGFVERGEQPPIDGSEETRRTLGRMYPHDDGEYADPSALLRELVIAHAIAKTTEKDATLEKQRIANVIRGQLGDHAGVVGDDYKAYLRNNKDGTKVEWPAVALELAALVDDMDTESVLARAVARHTQPVPGARPLNTYVLDEETSKWL